MDKKELKAALDEQNQLDIKKCVEAIASMLKEHNCVLVCTPKFIQQTGGIWGITTEISVGKANN